ncbi:winged helix-turn-helix domain-containing protein [Variovorax paradoxus]|uniref:winged helix-turn-helix domain-containing protein n=1 Tax=Variovorax paradoxus TaxID=34073 RepID=UPI0027D7B8EA|nr:winged helix-turn-helix domain-containing protein [Variovorax paradoxus]
MGQFSGSHEKDQSSEPEAAPNQRGHFRLLRMMKSEFGFCAAGDAAKWTSSLRPFGATVEALGPQALSVALIGTGDGRGAALGARLASMGHEPVVFTGVAGFLSKLRSGRHFDVLLMSPHGGLFDEPPFPGGEVLRIPTLFLVPWRMWSHLPPWERNLEWLDVVDFDILRTTDDELNWRMRALFSRKSRRTDAALGPITKLTWGDYQFLEDRCIVLHRSRKVFLQPLQFKCALAFFQNVGRVLTRDELWHSFWATSYARDEGSRVIDVCIANVRRKLALREESGYALRAVYKTGYRLSML